MKVAIEGCCHDTLDKIYETLKYIENTKQIRIDLLLICGDFESTRNLNDLECMNVPAKYKKLGSFYKYYSGKEKAPYLTIFIGGNHEAVNYLWELYYGGWVCENIYFMGHSNVINFGGLRIGGISGIYNSSDYYLGYHETYPYIRSTKISSYHIRNYEICKLQQIQKPMDIFLSHDWPQDISYHGDLNGLLKRKPGLERDIVSGKLGCPAFKDLLHKIKPKFWFAAHHHTKFSAIVRHDSSSRNNMDRDLLAFRGFSSEEKVVNPDEIDMDLDDSEDKEEEVSLSNADLPSSLPSSNITTKFLSLDKCLPGRKFLQILEIPSDDNEIVELKYDEEWLAIIKATSPYFSTSRYEKNLPTDEEIRSKVEAELKWIKENVSNKGPGLLIPKNFQPTAPAYDDTLPPDQQAPFNMGIPFLNPQTVSFTSLLDIKNEINVKGQATSNPDVNTDTIPLTNID